MNPYFFIVDCPGSGETLLLRMLEAHPEIACMSETRWITEVVRHGRGIDIGGRVTARLGAALIAHPRFATLGVGSLEVERLIAQRPSYPAFVTALFDWDGAERGKPIVGDQTPGYVWEVAFLHDAFPHARFVHLVRDGRDVYLSAPESERDVTTAARSWSSKVMEGRWAGNRLPGDRYLELRYEALVAEPEGECRRLCEFLRVEFDPAMLRRSRFARTRDWTTQMPRDLVGEFEAAAGDALDAFGYARSAPAWEESS